MERKENFGEKMSFKKGSQITPRLKREDENAG
jgi:hypothetical protein